MKIILIRHAEPCYETDSLTDKGKKEAALLAQRTRHWHISQAYCSPLGRAQDTALPSLEAQGIRLECRYPSPAEDILKEPDPKTCLVYPWLREFSVPIDPDRHPAGQRIPWDYTPRYLSDHPELYSPRAWFSSPIYCGDDDHASNLDCIPTEHTSQVRAIYGQYFKRDPGKTYIQQEYEWVTGRFDRVLSQWGYQRDGLCYRTSGHSLPSNAYIRYDAHTIDHMKQEEAALASSGEEEPVLVFFCHFGVSCILISHLINSTPAAIQHGFFLPPSSVTVFSSEERVPGQALFRCQTAGDTSHLRIAGEPCSFYGSFAIPFQG